MWIDLVHKLAELLCVVVVLATRHLRPSFSGYAGAKLKRLSEQVQSAALHLILVGRRPSANPSSQGAIRAGAR
jgi:hypothetical protein